MTMTDTVFTPLFGEADGYDGEGYDARGADRNGYGRDGCPVSVAAADLKLASLWDAFGSSSRSAFLEYLRTITREPHMIDEVAFCISCSEPVWRDETTAARGAGSERVCDDCCSDDWAGCDRCGDMYPSGELNSTLNDDSVCEDCRDRWYWYCEYCDGYDGEEHDHEEDQSAGCCEAPAQKFTVRNGGGEPLANDTRVTVTLPAGVISSEGLRRIRSCLRSSRSPVESPADRAHLYALSHDLDVLGDKWQSKEGNFTKRLSRLAYKNYQLKLSPGILSEIGNIARAHSGDQSSYRVAVTRDLNMSAHDFGHEDSCWWGSYSESRCALKSNGGFGMRAFGPGGSVSGRAWVMPLKISAGGHLEPTFETASPDAFIIFNGYGELTGGTPARILAQMTGWTYRKVAFLCDPMYVNSHCGYLVAPEETAGKYTGSGLHLNVPQHSDLYGNERRAQEAERELAEKEKERASA